MTETDHDSGSAPLWLHAIGLLVVLLVLVPVVRLNVSYSADEGVAIIQAASLADGDGWVVPHPLPEVDPDQELYPLEYATFGSDGPVAYAKHPAYPVLLAWADDLGGEPAMVVLSVLGTWAAALASALLAQSIARGYARTSLWVAGIASPLLFNAYWVIAHSLAAAAIGFAAVLVLRAQRSRSTIRTTIVMVASTALVIGATLVRTEAAIFGAALGVGACIVGVTARRLAASIGGVAIAAGALVARQLDDRLYRNVVEGVERTTSAFDPRPRSGAVSERLDGFVETWLRPAPAGTSGSGALLVMLGLALFTLGAIALYRRRSDGALVLFGAGAVALVLRAVAVSPVRIPGLLMAFPLLVVGLVGLPRSPVWRSDRSSSAALLLGVVLASWGGVLLTQYAEGGVAEWGGRYFAVGLPLAVPLAVVGTAALVSEAPRPHTRVVVVALGVGLVALSIASIRELRSSHQDTDAALEEIDALAARAGTSPVIVTDAPAIPRLDWERFDEHRWVLVDPAEHPDLPARLAAEGVTSWVLVTADADGALAAFDDVTVRAEASPAILLVEHTG